MPFVPRKTGLLPALMSAVLLAGCHLHILIDSDQHEPPRPADLSRQGAARPSGVIASAANPRSATFSSPQSRRLRAEDASSPIQQTAGWRPTATPLNSGQPVRQTAVNAAVISPPLMTIDGGEVGAVPPSPTGDASSPMQVQIPPGRYPINLPTVLQLAGAENWSVQLAAERIQEAQARLDAAHALWLPSLAAGVGYTKHEGQIQATPGPVIDVSRNSLFVGGGAGSGNAPLTGGAGGPARLFVDLSVTDAIFEPLAAHQLVHAEQARHSAAFNDTLLEATVAYYELFKSQAQLANLRTIARSDIELAEELLKLTRAFVEAGKGSQADLSRAEVEISRREQEAIDAEMDVKVASAELARVLRLNPSSLGSETLLFAPDMQPVPVELVNRSTPLDSLIALGQAARPEVAELQSRVEANLSRVRAEQVRPFIPNLFVGASAGGFGGGTGGDVKQFDGRADFDILAVWQVRNLGFGNGAARDERYSQYRQSLLDNHRVRDQVAADVTKAFHQVQSGHQKMMLARANVTRALQLYRRNIARIRGLEGLPLEALQAVQAVTQARRDYLDAVIKYNESQARLLWSTGRPVVEG